MPLNLAWIPNFKNVMPEWQKPNYDSGADGKKYSVPYDWGSTGIVQRLDKLSDNITKWADLWNPKYKGMMTMLNDARETPGAALKMLGYSLNSTDPAQVNQAVEKLIEQKPLVQQYNSTNNIGNITRGVPLVHCWSGNVVLAWRNLGVKNVKYILPEEGYTLWADNLAIPVGARSYYGAHLFLNWLYEPENYAFNENWVGYSCVNAPAYNLMDPMINRVAPSAADMQRGEVMNDVGGTASLYTDGWARVKAA
jgi:spermidine/putrescine transport system substrate-binding protein